MVNESKDTIANVVTIAGTGAAVMGLNEILTLVMILTGITLNVVRIIETRKRKKD